MEHPDFPVGTKVLVNPKCCWAGKSDTEPFESEVVENTRFHPDTIAVKDDEDENWPWACCENCLTKI